MKKIITTMFTFTILLLTVMSSTWAWAWDVECVNRSCRATAGDLTVAWVQTGGTYTGKLTAVRGLPIGVEQFRSTEEDAAQTIEKAMHRRQTASLDVTADGPEAGGAKAGVSAQQENMFSRNQTMSQRKTKGQRFNVDYSIAFIKWYGDNFFQGTNIERYLSAADRVMTYYLGDRLTEIDDLLAYFFLSRGIESLADVPFECPATTPENADIRLMAMIKYMGLYGPGPKKDRYTAALVRHFALSRQEGSKEEAGTLSREYRADCDSFRAITQPGADLLSVSHTNKEAGFVKWLSESDTDGRQICGTIPIPDCYVLAMTHVRSGKADARRPDYVAAIAAATATAAAAPKRSTAPAPAQAPRHWVPITGAGIGVVGLIAGGVVYWRRKKLP